MQAKKRDEIDVCGGGREPAVCNVAEAPKHTICGAVYFFVSPPPLRRRVIAFALQFLVWLAENREGDLMNQRTLQRTRFML